MALPPDAACDWARHQRAGIDLVVFEHGRRIGIQRKRADAPVLPPSIRIVLADRKLDEWRVVHPGEKRYPLAKLVNAKWAWSSGFTRPLTRFQFRFGSRCGGATQCQIR